MATMSSRMARLKENLPSIINQSYNFDKLIINIDDNITEEEYSFYLELKKEDERIEIKKRDSKLRSYKKLLPVLPEYPDDVIITIDDDIYYPKDCFKYLVEQYEKTPDCIIAHETNPILINKEKNYVDFIIGFDIKLLQKSWPKYLSGCALFPPHVFDGTDIFDIEKMMYCTKGLHDELWFWVNSTLNGVMVVGLNYVRSFEPEVLTPYNEDEFRLANINAKNSQNKEYMDAINELYGERLLVQINSKKVLFEINKDNVYSFLFLLPYIRSFYNYGCTVKVDNLTRDWKYKVLNAIKSDDKPTI